MTSDLTESDIRRIVRDELAEQMAGLSTGGNVDPDKPEVERRAESVMLVGDLKTQHTDDLSARETLKRRYGIDAEEYSSEADLRAAVKERRN